MKKFKFQSGNRIKTIESGEPIFPRVDYNKYKTDKSNKELNSNSFQLPQNLATGRVESVSSPIEDVVEMAGPGILLSLFRGFGKKVLKKGAGNVVKKVTKNDYIKNRGEKLIPETKFKTHPGLTNLNKRVGEGTPDLDKIRKQEKLIEELEENLNEMLQIYDPSHPVIKRNVEYIRQQEKNLKLFENPYVPAKEKFEFEEGGKTPAWQRKEGKNPDGGLNDKGRKSYEKENPGSNLKRPQPEGGKRKKSFCARSEGQQKMHNIDCRKTPDKRICKAQRKWKCEKGGLLKFKKGGDVSYPGAGTKDACYKKGVEKYGEKTSAYRSGFISKCRKAKMKK